MQSSTRSLFDHELDQLRDNLIRLGNMVETAIHQSIAALKNRDAALAQQVIDHDQDINQLRYEIEESNIEMIATQQPMASDLRTIIAGTHIAVELERMGDHAEGIASLALRIVEEPLLKPLIDVPRMAEIGTEMIRAALQAFIEKDVALAKATAARDEEIDQLHQQVVRELLTYMIEDPRNIQRATYLLWVSHNLERIGDRATNICERILFMATGELKELDHIEPADQAA